MGVKRWSEEEIRFLKFAYPNTTAKEIANELGRIEHQVHTKASALKIKKNKEVLPEGYKRCPRCKVILSNDSFYKDNSWCKECQSEHKRIKKHQIVNCEKSSQTLTTKKCSSCGEVKSINEYGRNKGAPDGFQWYCKECKKIKDKDSKIKMMKERGW